MQPLCWPSPLRLLLGGGGRGRRGLLGPRHTPRMGALVVDSGSGMLTMLGFSGDVLVRAVFPSVVVRLVMLGIMAVINQKDSTALVVNRGSGMCKVGCTGDSAPRAVFLSLSSFPGCTASRRVRTTRTDIVRMVDIPVKLRLQWQNAVEVPQLPFLGSRNALFDSGYIFCVSEGDFWKNSWFPT